MEVVTIERRGNAKFEDIRHLVSGARGRLVYEQGDPDIGIWSAGITVGLINDVPTCDELLKTLERDVEDIVGGLNKIVTLEKAKL
jgi:NADH:quinone reductase (non-electrogenic)